MAKKVGLAGNFAIVAKILLALKSAANRKQAAKELEKQFGIKINPETVKDWLKLILEFLPLFIALFAKKS